MRITRRDFVSGGAIAVGVGSAALVPATAFAVLPPSGIISVTPSEDVTGVTDRAAIQNAIDTLEAGGYGGIVEINAGPVYIDQRLIVRNRVTVRGKNGRGTEIMPGSSFNDSYMFEFLNRAVIGGVLTPVSQFNCRLEDLSIRVLGNASITAAVWARSWNEQCGLRNVLIWEHKKHAVMFTDAFGGTATFEIRECEFQAHANASASYSGLFMTTPNISGYTNAILHHVVVTGPVPNTNYTCIEARNGVNLLVTGGHVEQCEYGIYMTNRSNLSLNGFTGSPTSVVNLIGCAGDFSGKVFGSGVLKGGATGHVLRDNKLGNHVTTEQNPLVFP